MEAILKNLASKLPKEELDKIPPDLLEETLLKVLLLKLPENERQKFEPQFLYYIEAKKQIMELKNQK
jgi:hypothetical protein